MPFPITELQMRSYGGFVPHPSDVIRRKGLAYFEEVEQDLHLRGELNTRAMNAITPGYVVNPGGELKRDQKLAEFVKWNFETIDGTIISDLMAMCDAIGQGFAVFEPIYERVTSGPWSGYLRLKRLKKIPAKYVGFDFDEAGEIKSDGLVFTPVWGGAQGRRFRYRDFVHLWYGPTDNPYGVAADLDCAFPVWIKKNATKFWAIWAERFAMPIVKGQMPKNAKSEDITKLKDILNELQTESGVLLPAGFDIAFLEAMRAGDANYDPLIDRCNREISKRILGATQSVEGASKGQSGGYAQAKQHGGITDNYAYIDALWLEFNITTKVLRPLVDLNFDGVVNYPEFKILDDNVALMVALSQSVPQLVSAGVPIPADWIMNRLHIPPAEPGQDILSPPTSVGGLRGVPSAASGVAGVVKPAAPDNKTLNSAFGSPSASAGGPRGELGSPSASLHRFSADNSRAELFDRLEQQHLDELRAIYGDLFDDVEAQAQELPAGDVITQVPALKLNLGALKTSLMLAALQVYLYGKIYGSAELVRGGVDIQPSDRPARLPAKLAKGLKSGGGVETPGDTLTLAARKIPLTQESLDALIEQYQQRFFEVSGLERAEIEAVWKTQILALREGWTLRDFTAKLREQLIPLSKQRIELVYRNWMMRAFAEGKSALANDPDIAGFVYGYRYNGILDSRIRPTHERLDGTVRPLNDPFWQKFTPPIFHNCRCDREFVTQQDITDGTYTETPVPETADIETFALS